LSGLLGLTVGVLLISAWLVTEKSFGVPFLTPVAPKTKRARPAILRGTLSQRQQAEDYMNTGDKRS
ncbi:MAG: spore germination protein, partial [Eubacteriales bacterium]|nr:spore germination protein [Eubacteriales bacterium]